MKRKCEHRHRKFSTRAQCLYKGAAVDGNGKYGVYFYTDQFLPDLLILFPTEAEARREHANTWGQARTLVTL